MTSPDRAIDHRSDGAGRCMRGLRRVPTIVAGAVAAVAAIATPPAPASPPPPHAARAAATAPDTADAPAASAQAEVSVSASKARIGDRIRLTASYPRPGTWTAAPGEALKPGEKLGPFRILAADASAPGVLHLDLGADETGDLATPSFTVVFRDPAGTAVTVTVPAVKVAVASVLAEGDSTAIADLKPPAELPVPWPWMTLMLLGAAVAIAAGATWWLARWLRRARAPRPVPEMALPPGVTPEAWAREELAKLLASGLLEAGRHREFHIVLADLLRRYLELRFRLPAMERTTEEIADEMPRALVGGEFARLTVAALSTCDRVKFAKHVPSNDEVEGAVRQVRAILDLGVPAPAPVAALDAAGTAA